MGASSLNPPPAPACLERAYPSSQKGGTLIAEDVTELAEHERRMRCPNRYRPERCPRCGHAVMHVHDRRWRVLYAQPERRGVWVLRFRCASKECGARWQVLPAFVARHLWRSWAVVEKATEQSSAPPGLWPKVPARTLRRWTGRLLSAARSLVELLAKQEPEPESVVARRVGRGVVDRQGLVDALGVSLGALAALVHRLRRGLRLM